MTYAELMERAQRLYDEAWVRTWVAEAAGSYLVLLHRYCRRRFPERDCEYLLCMAWDLCGHRLDTKARSA